MSLPHLTHPGPAVGPRLTAVACTAHPVTLRLPAGARVTQAVAEALQRAGFAAGYLRLDGVALAALRYVIPAPGPGDGRVAWYGETRQLNGARVIAAGLHLGEAGGAPFCHCHGIWAEDAAPAVMGHLLCDESVLARDAVVSGWGISGARLSRQDDPETGFALFEPVAVAAAPHEDGAPRGAARLCRIRPNADLATELGRLRVGRAQVEGIGSLIGVAFEAAPPVAGPAAEVLITRGALDARSLSLEIAAVGMDGGLREGVPARGRNAVCITAELLVLPAVAP
ncbi:MAG: DUF296 domain-containing protein [Roseovarius sp.]|nr:DUF296 domain-containing protein [Roseovarius sp.]